MFGLSSIELFMVFAVFAPLAILLAGLAALFLYAAMLIAGDGFHRLLNSMRMRHGKAH